MKKKATKVLLLTVKITIAALLLGWVISRSHWNHYVVDKQTGQSWSVPDGAPQGGTPQKLAVTRGLWWWKEVRKNVPITEFEGAGKPGTIRPGVAASLQNIKIPYLVFGCLGFGISLTIIAFRWRYLLRMQDVRISGWQAVRLTFLGQFFNTVVPGTVGGDLVKAYHVARHTSKKMAVVLSVFVDRIMGLTEMTLLASVMLTAILVLGVGSLDDPVIRGAAIAAGTIILITTSALVFLFSSRVRRILHLQKIYQRLPIAHHFAAMGDAALIYRRNIRGVLKVALMTFWAHLAWIGSVAFLGASLSLPIPWYSYFVYIPLIYTIGAIPITPGGVGLIEDLYLRFFVTATAAASASMVLALALLARIVPILWGLPGLWVMITGPKLPKADVVEAELGLVDDGPDEAGGPGGDPSDDQTDEPLESPEIHSPLQVEPAGYPVTK